LKIFFDVDGVVLEGWQAKAAQGQLWYATLERDLGVDREALQRALFLPPADGAAPAIAACARGTEDLKDLLAGLLPTLGYSGSVDAFVAYWFQKDAIIDRSVLTIVKRLRQGGQVELFLATNQEHHRAAYLWNDLGLKDHFDDIFYSARLGVLKDDTAFFAKINAQLDIASAEQPLFFDDQDKFVTTARAAGWDAHLFNRAEDLGRNPRLRGLLGSPV